MMMSSKNKKMITVGAILIFLIAIFFVGYSLVVEQIGAGYVGYIYDRTIKNGDVGTIPGTSVVDNPLTGRIYLNPFTQEVITYPTTIVSRNWTAAGEEGKDSEDFSMQAGSKEGKNSNADIYFSAKPNDMSKLISSFGIKSFDTIVDNDLYGLVKGKLNSVAQAYSVYDIQGSRTEIQDKTVELLGKELLEIYGVEIVRFEIGTISPPIDIQAKIDQKTEAMNAVELAKLERQKQDEVNQKVVDEQKAISEKDYLKRKSEADAAAYEKQAAAKASLDIAQSNVDIASKQVEQAKLEKEAELQKQQGFTPEYFENKRLDVQKEAVAKINGSVKTIITDGSDSNSGFGGLVGIKEILKSLDEPTK